MAPVLVKSASIRLSALYAAMNVEDMAAPVRAAGVYTERDAMWLAADPGHASRGRWKTILNAGCCIKEAM